MSKCVLKDNHEKELWMNTVTTLLRKDINEISACRTADRVVESFRERVNSLDPTNIKS